MYKARWSQQETDFLLGNLLLDNKQMSVELNKKFHSKKTTSSVYHKKLSLSLLHPKKNTKWLADELSYFYSLVDKHPTKEIVNLINKKFNNGRTVQSLYPKLKKTRNNYRYWSPEEDFYLTDLFDKGYNYKKIVEKLNLKFSNERTTTAVKIRLNKELGILISKPMQGHNYITEAQLEREANVDRDCILNLKKRGLITPKIVDTMILYDGSVIDIVKNYKNSQIELYKKMEKTHYTTSQAIWCLSVSKDTLFWYIKNGDIDSVIVEKAGVKHRFCSKVDVLRLKKQLEDIENNYIDLTTLANYYNMSHATICKWIKIKIIPENLIISHKKKRFIHKSVYNKVKIKKTA